jgi:propanol-preferring alcohol dehydrogenase
MVDGAMAEYLLVPAARHLVPLGDLDPVAAVALTDAGLTSYHAIITSMPRLLPGSTALVIGIGGLGHMAVQILRALAGETTVIAVDAREDKLELGRKVGAHHTLLAGPSTADRVRDLTAGAGANLVLDMVCAQSTVDLARRSVAIGGDIAMIGTGSGILGVGVGQMAFQASVRRPFWGSLPDLWEVVALARNGRIHTEFEAHPLESGPEVYERLKAGEVRGRAVLVPGRPS